MDPAESRVHGAPQYDGPHQELFDWALIHCYVRFAFGSVRRRAGLFAAVAGGMLATAAIGLAVMPKTYEVEAKLLAQKNPVLAVRADANSMDSPTRAAAEQILRRENLHAIIRQTDLLSEWPKRRAPILRLKDRVMARLASPASESQMLDALSGLLERQLQVWTTGDGAVTIRLQWPDALMAYRLVDAAQQNYLETKHVQEISTIAEQIGILEGYSTKLKAEVDRGLAELLALRQKASHRGRVPARPAVPTPLAPEASPELANLRARLEAKRRMIADLDEYRLRHLSQQQTRLSELQAIYSDTNPIVIDLKQSIESLQGDSPQLRTLRREEAELRHELEAHADRGGSPPSMNSVLQQELFRMDRDGEDPTIEYARAQVRYAAGQYGAIRDRIDAARIDLDTARAAFKHRYSVVVPPEVPRGPVKPKPLMVMLAALIAGLALGLFATTLSDLRSGAVLERWQLESLLGQTRQIVVVEVPFR